METKKKGKKSPQFFIGCLSSQFNRWASKPATSRQASARQHVWCAVELLTQSPLPPPHTHYKVKVGSTIKKFGTHFPPFSPFFIIIIFFFLFFAYISWGNRSSMRGKRERGCPQQGFSSNNSAYSWGRSLPSWNRDNPCLCFFLFFPLLVVVYSFLEGRLSKISHRNHSGYCFFWLSFFGFLVVGVLRYCSCLTCSD